MKRILSKAGLTILILGTVVLGLGLRTNCSRCRFEEIHSGDSTRGFCGLSIDRASGSYALNEFYFEPENNLRYNTLIVSGEDRRELKIDAQLLCLLEVDGSIVAFDSSHVYKLASDGKVLSSSDITVRNPYKAKSDCGVLYFNETHDQIVAMNIISMKTDTLVTEQELLNLITPRPISCKIEDFDVRNDKLCAIVNAKTADQTTSFLIEKSLKIKETCCVIRKVKNRKGQATYYKSPLISTDRRGSVYLVAESDSNSILYCLNRKCLANEVYFIPNKIEIEQFFILENGQALFCGANKEKRTFNYGIEPIKNYSKTLYSWVSIYRLDLNECRSTTIPLSKK